MSESDATQFRDNGAMGALLDEYEKAINELIFVVKDISPAQLPIIVDHQTKDEDCRSIQTILTHVIRAGYAYATYIRNHQGEKLTFQKPDLLDSSKKYIVAFKEMFQFTEKVFADYPNITLEEKDSSLKMLVSWGQLYDTEQLMEHAIVHILRHRRQIERFLMKST
jgi:uncharacterized damage-inducible protein DinB